MMAGARSPLHSASSRRSSGRARRCKDTQRQAVPEVLFVAGESSGDLHAAGVAEELARLRPDLELTGFGGPLMKKAGVNLFDQYDTGVMGFLEVIRHIPRHFTL